VSFVRLDETLAGNLVVGERIPELDQLFGGAMLINNQISTELKQLFQFAHKTVVPARNLSLQVTVSAPHPDGKVETQSADLPSLNARANETRRLWSISSEMAAFNPSQEYDVSLERAQAVIYSTNRWPDGFKQTYDCDNDAIQCAVVWRYVSQLSELDELERDTDKMVARAQKNATAKERREDARRDKSDWSADHQYVYKTHFSLFRYLGRSGWPEKFLVLRGWQANCAGIFDFFYTMPTLAFDVAIVENSSPEQIRIQALVGAMQPNSGLRLSEGLNASADTPAPLGMPGLELPPKGKIIIPLRITFTGGPAPGSWDPMPDAQKMYQRIQSMPSKTTFTLRVKPMNVVIKKAKGEYKLPQVPESAEYQFGPRLLLSGFLVEKERFQVEQTETNLVTLYGSSDNEVTQDEQQSQTPDVEVRLHANVSITGSCPILYSWDGETDDWVYLGKVIHTANTQDKEMTSVIDVGPEQKRFSLEEKELEVSFLRRARLIITLRDGRRVMINSADLDQMRNGDSFFRIPPYSKLDFSFSVPQEYSTIGIQRAQLAITGFYNRYSAIAASDIARHNRRTH
jgi:hypothetical protein